MIRGDSMSHTMYKRLLLAHRLAAGSGSYIEQTETGNPATFSTTLAKTLKQCKVNFMPELSGSGSQSPTNVRSVTGWTGVNVYHSGENTSNPTIYPVTWTSQGVAYGGYVDLVSGVLVSEYGFKVFTGTEVNSWNVYSGSVYTSKNVFPGIESNSSQKIYGYSSMVVSLNGGELNTSYIKQAYSDHGVQFYQVSSLWGLSDVTSLAWNSKLAEWYANDTPLTVAYKLGIPTQYQLTPQQITTLIGTNNIWSDANGDLDITYLTTN